MTITVRLDPRVQGIITQLARRQGKTKSAVVREAVQLYASTQKKKVRKTSLYSRISHLIGCVDSGGMNLSQDTGEKFRKILQEKHSRERNPA
ncbi:MAG: ribbon-helix-helix protein, CopG family [Acidobacteria bacterium]|nr:ribbon-helix-helix protein, CopG family [Acidobacteriota bacterium]MCI0625565.1 ribbon-helix-helix protein, CopG family [Acidobacteriota bacterium]MCI0719550.1 ribbon-helix-helix protein, CopG family [Acidobacteriota bacterium]